jgi:tetratricopeptide (TPR) repeat protein
MSQELGPSDEAIGHYRELLRLNPTDNQGVRYGLLKVLFASELDQEAMALLEQFPDDPTAMWLYGRALSAFRRHEGSLDARARLRRALGANRSVAKYLTGKKRLPPDDPTSFALASEEEAVICARALATAWRATPRAVDWLRNEVAAKKSCKRR